MYPRDIFPSFWERFEKLCDENDIVSPDAVIKELSEKDADELYEWCKSKACFQYPLESDFQQAVKKVMAECNLVNIRKSRSDADAFVIGFAILNDLTVISQEEPRKRKQDMMKIPDACEHLGIRHIPITGLIREQGWTF